MIKERHILMILLAFAALLLFTNLGDRFVFGDEAYTVMVSNSILENGYPTTTYNGFEINPKETAEFNGIYSWNSWGQFYITAFTLLVFGMNEFALRFPYVLVAFLTIPLLYLFVKRLSKNSTIALLSSLFLVTSIPFILHARQIRWYSLSTALVLATVFAYWIFVKERRFLELIIAPVLLFHTNILIFIVLMLVLVVHYILFHRKSIRKFIFSAAMIGVFTLPWFLLTGQSSKFGGTTFSLQTILIHLTLNWYYVFVLILPAIFLLVFAFKRQRRELLDRYFLILFVIFGFIFVLSLKSDVLPAIRYLVVLIPLTSIILAYVVYQIQEKNKILAAAVIFLLIFTNLLFLFPFPAFKSMADRVPLAVSDYEKQSFIEKTTSLQFYFSDYLYEISNEYEGTEELIISYLLEHGSSSDTFTTSHHPHPIIDYTNMTFVSLDENPDWIIKRSFRIHEEEIQAVFEGADLSDYQPIEIQTKDERWADAPDPLNHKFRTDNDGKVFLYRRVNNQ